MREGWICPKCQRGVSPDEKHCNCTVGAIGIPYVPSVLPFEQPLPDTILYPTWDPRKPLTGGTITMLSDGLVWNGTQWENQEITRC